MLLIDILEEWLFDRLQETLEFDVVDGRCLTDCRRHWSLMLLVVVV